MKCLFSSFFSSFFLFFSFFELDSQSADDYKSGTSVSFSVLHAALKRFAMSSLCCQIFSN